MHHSPLQYNPNIIQYNTDLNPAPTFEYLCAVQTCSPSESPFPTTDGWLLGQHVTIAQQLLAIASLQVLEFHTTRYRT